MKKIDYFIPVIVILLVLSLAGIMYFDMNKDGYKLEAKSVNKLLNYDLKKLEKTFGKDAKVINLNSDYPLVYCYKKDNICFSIENDKVNAIILNKEYNNTHDDIEIGDSFNSLIKKYQLLISEYKSGECIVKKSSFNKDNLTLNFISNVICKDDEEVLETLIIRLDSDV